MTTSTTKTNFWKTNLGKTVQAAGYLALSSVITYLATATTGDPELFGPWTPIINLVLVFIVKTFFSTSTPNVGSRLAL